MSLRAVPPPVWRLWIIFFFQAEDGIRDDLVTGVHTCALPILKKLARGPCPYFRNRRPTVSTGREPTSSPCASSIRAHSRGASSASPLCSSCAMLVSPSCVLLCSALLCLP